MEAFLATFLGVLAVEFTDKTRLIALLLSTRYRTPFQLFFGMTLGYVLPIALAVWGAGFVTAWIPPHLLRWLVAASFLGFGLLMLLSHNEHGEEAEEKWLARLSHLPPFWIG